MKILFLTLYPKLQPSTRFRVIQLLPYLDEAVKYRVKPLLPETFFNRLYGGGNLIQKTAFHALEFLFRLKDLFSVFGYDIIFLQKGITTINLRYLYLILFMLSKKVIFDFDDAITISQITKINKFPWHMFQDNSEWRKIVKLSYKVIVGNEKLKSDIQDLNSNIYVIPTPVDTGYYAINPNKYRAKDRIVILWSGNKSGHVYLYICASAISRLSERYSIELNILTDDPDKKLYSMFGKSKVNIVRWNIENEKMAFAEADIGIMPLYDTLWDRRKCAFKALLYMASGIPSISSPVGIIRDIIDEGKNGLLAETEDEWADKLELLIKDSSLRRNIGLAGRRTVEEGFSLSKWGPRWREVLTST